LGFHIAPLGRKSHDVMSRGVFKAQSGWGNAIHSKRALDPKHVPRDLIAVTVSDVGDNGFVDVPSAEFSLQAPYGLTQARDASFSWRALISCVFYKHVHSGVECRREAILVHAATCPFKVSKVICACYS
jgi:hypothetical protein